MDRSSLRNDYAIAQSFKDRELIGARFQNLDLAPSLRCLCRSATAYDLRLLLPGRERPSAAAV